MVETISFLSAELGDNRGSGRAGSFYETTGMLYSLNHLAVPERIVISEKLMETTDILLELQDNEYICTEREEDCKYQIMQNS